MIYHTIRERDVNNSEYINNEFETLFGAIFGESNFIFVDYYLFNKRNLKNNENYFKKSRIILIYKHGLF